ncbi:MAG: hypothetical protein JWL81_25, partial [Verrucomicrobiales bacterium]|nr:hypothetical protein [Verrucomicrobiales bacterium]
MLFSPQGAAAVIAQTPGPLSNGGATIGFLLMLLATAKTVSLLFRPGVSRLCIWSLLVFCLNWLFTGMVRVVLGNMDHVPAWLFPVSVLVIVIYLIAVVLGISGLVVWSHGNGRYVQGKRQAITAIAVSTLFIVVQVRELAALGPQALAALAGVSGSPAPGGRFLNLQDYPEHNFAFAKPDSPWLAGPADKAPKGSTLFHVRAGVPGYLAAIVEPNPDGLDADRVGKILIAHMKTVARTSEELPPSTTTVRGLTFHRFPAKCNGVANVFMDIYYEYWV